MKLKISSRQSDLAKNQAFQVGDALIKINPEIQIEYLFRESLGDKNLTDPLWKMPEKGVFTEDFYQDLVEEKTDLVVHSWKDLPTEVKAETQIAATLPRADQRDFLIYKPSSIDKKKVTLFSSSPRRVHNLTPFLKVALPSLPIEVSFQSVRGNIQTRIRKLIEDPQVDGLILAKAALDRLVQDHRAIETREFVKSVLAKYKWMVLPLRENPNAAAQGAIAIEIKSSRKDVFDVLQKINCVESFKSAEAERNLLKKFGGGCHLALGMSVLQRSYGQVEIVKGLTPKNETVNIEKYISNKPLPNGLKPQRLKFKTERENLPVLDLKEVDAVYVAKAEAWNFETQVSGLVWSSGLETWKKLARKGIWVSGSNESLGEFEEMQIDHFFEKSLTWARLSHDAASPEGSKKHIGSYRVQVDVEDQYIDPKAAYSWMSPLEFDVAIKKYPELLSCLHVCGAGRTFEALKKRLGSDKNLYIELFLY
jgi:hydroxymethylbilane synthase